MSRSQFAAVYVILLLTGLFGVAIPNAAAQEFSTMTLRSTAETASWSGQFAAGASAPSAAACTPQLCDFVTVQLRLPENSWRKPGGMLVAIQPGAEFEIAGLDLFVYPPGCAPPTTCEPAAQSAHLMPSEAAWIANPVNGDYTVVVVPTAVAGQPYSAGVADPLRYEGFAKFQDGLTLEREERNFDQRFVRKIVAFGISDKEPARELLPDLVPRTPRHFQIAYGGADAQAPGGCLPTETVGLHDDDPTTSDEPPVRCLRFDQGEFNDGDGPFQLNIYDVNDDPVAADFRAYQRIYRSDGTVRQEPVGSVVYSEAHGHFHYLGYQDLTLHRIDADGSLTLVTRKPDKGWCMVDMWLGRFGITELQVSPPSYPVRQRRVLRDRLARGPERPHLPRWQAVRRNGRLRRLGRHLPDDAARAVHQRQRPS